MMEAPKADLASFVRLSDSDRKPNAPRLTWKVEGEKRLSLTMPYLIESSIHRAADDDSDSRRCTFYFHMERHSFTDNGWILARHTDDSGFERVPVDNPTSDPAPTSHIVSGREHIATQELAPEKHTVPSRVHLPERYFRVLKAGETYSLVFPGMEIELWAWGSIADNQNRRMQAGGDKGQAAVEDQKMKAGKKKGKTSKEKDKASIVIPGGILLTFTAVEEEVPWPPRADRESQVGIARANWEEKMWRIGLREGKRHPSERVLGAPVFSAKLRCPSTFQNRGRFAVELTIKYRGVQREEGVDMENAPPVTFHWLSVVSSDYGFDGGYSLYRRKHDTDASDPSPYSYQDWVPCSYQDTSTGFMIFDAPDIEVCVGKQDNYSSHFTSLKPGDTWTDTEMVSDGEWAELPSDTAPGDAFRFEFHGATVDWWDWGTIEDHTETKVKLPCWEAAPVLEPSDNGGRPRLSIPHAKPVEFKIVQ